MKSSHFKVVLILGSNFQRAVNFKKALLLIESNYKVEKRSSIYRSDDINKKGSFYWNMALLVESTKIKSLKRELVKIEKQCGRIWEASKKIIAIDIDVALIYEKKSSSSEYGLILNNTEGNTHSFLLLKEMMSAELSNSIFPADTTNCSPVIKKRLISLIPITEIYNVENHAS